MPYNVIDIGLRYASCVKQAKLLADIFIIANNLPILNDVEFRSWLFFSFGKSDCYPSALHDV